MNDRIREHDPDYGQGWIGLASIAVLVVTFLLGVAVGWWLVRD